MSTSMPPSLFRQTKMTVPTMTVAARMASLVSRRSLAAISAYRLARTSASAATPLAAMAADDYS